MKRSPDGPARTLPIPCFTKTIAKIPLERISSIGIFLSETLFHAFETRSHVVDHRATTIEKKFHQGPPCSTCAWP